MNKSTNHKKHDELMRLAKNWYQAALLAPDQASHDNAMRTADDLVDQAARLQEDDNIIHIGPREIVTCILLILLLCAEVMFFYDIGAFLLKLIAL